MHLQDPALFLSVQSAFDPQGEGLQGSGFSTHLCHACSQTKPLLQSESLVHSGPHPVIVSGLGINPGWQLHMAFPAALTVQVVP